MAPAGIGDSVEGIHAVAAAAAAGRVTELFVETTRAGDAEVQAIIEAVQAGGGTVRHVEQLVASTTAPQGVVAKARAMPIVEISSLATARPLPAVVVLDHLEDPRNVGAIARSAHASGATGMVVASRRAAPLTAAAFKAAAGSFEFLPLAVVSSIPRALDELKSAGLWVVALDADGDSSIFELDLLDEAVAVVVGAEGAGISRLAREKADVVASIPMAQDVESLNAAAAATVACFEIARRRGR